MQVRDLSGGEAGLPLPPDQFASALGSYGVSDDNNGGRVRWFLRPQEGDDDEQELGRYEGDVVVVALNGEEEEEVASVSVVAVLKMSSLASTAVGLYNLNPVDP